jgi:RimJ/RimL family protein N-acetyltransferase
MPRYGLFMQPVAALESNRLRLRRATLSDALPIFESYAQDPSVTRYLTWQPLTSLQQSEEFLTQVNRCWEDGESLAWTINLASSKQLIGMIEARIERHRVEVGYVLARSAWGAGFATEAVRLVTSWALSQPTIRCVWAYADVENLASIRVLEKAGYSRAGLLQSWANHPNVGDELRDCWVYSLSEEAAD